VEIHEMAADRHETATVEDLAARAELSGAVAEAMERLPEDQRTAIVLKEYHGLTFQEVAELMNCPLSTAKTRLYQGLSMLRRYLAEQGKFDPPAAGPKTKVTRKES
jgi:RNA polymerase sigma-70 factor (ECF subfamily)